MNIKPFGLDIGATTIKAVWLSKEKEGFLLSGAVIAGAPPKGMASESPADEEDMAKTIKKIIDEAKITSKSVNIALPENQVYTKVIEMPVLSDKELASAIFWEAEQHIPVPLPSVVLDWKVLRRPKTGEADQKMEVLLVGAQSTMVAKYERILSMAGFTINAVETEILSAVRALVLGDQFPVSLIVNIGAVSTSLCIVKNGAIAFTYAIATGGTAINRAIASDFGFEIGQAEEYKKIYGITQDALGGKIGQATMPVLTAIISEIKKAIAFYTEKYKDEEPIQQILLSGGTAKLTGINSFFAQNCGIETVIADPWKALSTQTVPQEILDDGPHYTIAVGLAMRDYE